MILFTWFSVDFGSDNLGLTGGIDTGANAWQAFGFIDIVLFVTILVAIGGAVIAANATSVNTPVAISAITCGLGILSVLLILFRIVDPPGPATSRRLRHRDQSRDRRLPRADRGRRNRLRRLARDGGGGHLLPAPGRPRQRRRRRFVSAPTASGRLIGVGTT